MCVCLCDLFCTYFGPPTEYTKLILAFQRVVSNSQCQGKLRALEYQRYL